MIILPAVLALAYSAAFKGCYLTERYLQERGVSPMRTLALYRYALIPALIWSAIFIRSDDIDLLVHTPYILTFLIVLAVLWNIQQFIASYLANSINSMSMLSTLRQLVHLPMLLLIGTYFNHDEPNIYSLLAVGALLGAFVLQPTTHERNVRAKYFLPLAVIVGLVIFRVTVESVNGGIYREMLKQIDPAVIIGAFSVLTLGLCAVWTSFFPSKPAEKKILRQRWRRASLVPGLWFLGTIPEAYVFAIVPLYVGESIAATAFLMDAGSDLINKRIHFNLRTAAFISLVLLGVGLAVYSIR